MVLSLATLVAAGGGALAKKLAARFRLGRGKGVGDRPTPAAMHGGIIAPALSREAAAALRIFGYRFHGLIRIIVAIRIPVPALGESGLAFRHGEKGKSQQKRRERPSR
jgi:hypothetical protein